MKKNPAMKEFQGIIFNFKISLMNMEHQTHWAALNESVTADYKAKQTQLRMLFDKLESGNFSEELEQLVEKYQPVFEYLNVLFGERTEEVIDPNSALYGKMIEVIDNFLKEVQPIEIKEKNEDFFAAILKKNKVERIKKAPEQQLLNDLDGLLKKL